MASTTVRMVAAGGPADSCRRGGWRGGRAGAAAAAAGRGTQAALPASVRLSKGSAAGRRGIRCAELQLCRRAVVARASEPQQTVMLDTVEEQLSSPTTTEDETLPYRQWTPQATAQPTLDPVRDGSNGVLNAQESADVQNAWNRLLRWSRIRMRREGKEDEDIRAAAKKVAILGGGSFGTAIASILATNKSDLDVVILLRDEGVCASINEQHVNSHYFPDHTLPTNVRATTDAATALSDVQYIVHAIPVQSSRTYLTRLKDLISPSTPIFSLSKGLEVGTGQIMTEIIDSSLDRKQPIVVLSGPSFAVELMQGLPTMLVAASDNSELAQCASAMLASPCLRVNLSDDVVGVEIAGALKNVLAIAAGIVEGLQLGNNAMAALTSQGVAEIRWLAEKMGAKPATLSGPAGVGDIMLTCFVNLSRNRTVGVRLGAGEQLEAILGTGRGVAEGVATAGVVIRLADRYNVSLPVLTAVSSILNDQMTPRDAVQQLMNMPQVPEV